VFIHVYTHTACTYVCMYSIHTTRWLVAEVYHRMEDQGSQWKCLREVCVCGVCAPDMKLLYCYTHSMWQWRNHVYKYIRLIREGMAQTQHQLSYSWKPLCCHKCERTSERGAEQENHKLHRQRYPRLLQWYSRKEKTCGGQSEVEWNRMPAQGNVELPTHQLGV